MPDIDGEFKRVLASLAQTQQGPPPAARYWCRLFFNAGYVAGKVAGIEWAGRRLDRITGLLAEWKAKEAKER